MIWVLGLGLGYWVWGLVLGVGGGKVFGEKSIYWGQVKPEQPHRKKRVK